MKNKIIINIAFALTFIVGFAIAWMFKPADTSNEKIHAHATQAAGKTTYTCSMHPQIRQNEPGICPICEMDLIPLDENISNDPLVLSMTEESTALANIQTTKIDFQDGSGRRKEIKLTGKIVADETQISSLVAHVPGRIEKLYISFTGEKVTKGQKLAEIYSPELIAAQQELLEAKKLSAINPGIFEAAKDKLKNWKIPTSTIEEVIASGNIIEQFTFYAEQSGTVQARKVSVGDYIRIGSPLFDLIDLTKVWAILDAYEEDLALIRVGDRMSFTVPALGNKSYSAIVNFINPVINTSTRTTSIRAEVSNSNGLLKPEMFIDGKIITIQGKSGSNLLVPKSAVLWTGKRSVVYVKLPDSTIPSFEYREVSLGERLGDYFQISSGLSAGDEVVTNGAFVIDASAQLNNQASMMNKDVVLKGTTVSTPALDFQEVISDEFQSQLNQVLIAYLELKNAMVETDSDRGKELAVNFAQKLDKVDRTQVTGEALQFWLDQLNILKAHARLLQEQEDITGQREQFEFISNSMIRAIRSFGVKEDTVYVQFCPMAFENKGAKWLSIDEAIQNPYFGDKMLKCGINQEIFYSKN